MLRLFLTCLDARSNTEYAKWLRKLKSDVHAKLMREAMMNGETMDKSETPIYLTHVVDMCRAYARFGSETADTSRLAAERKICIKMLWQVCLVAPSLLHAGQVTD